MITTLKQYLQYLYKIKFWQTLGITEEHWKILSLRVGVELVYDITVIAIF